MSTSSLAIALKCLHECRSPVIASMRRTPAATPLSETSEEADVAGGAHMRAAAEFLAEPGNRDDADLVAVLLAEQRHGASGDGLLRVLHVGLHRRVLQDLLVDDPLDLELLLARDRVEVDEVEPQPIGRDERAGLLDVRPEDLFAARRGADAWPCDSVESRHGRAAVTLAVSRSRGFSVPRVIRTAWSRGHAPTLTTPVTWPSPHGPLIVPISETCPPDSR